jgi:hypothetical protein
MNEFDSAKRTPLEDQLASALEKYSAVEPRPGLEERILVNLRSQQAASAHGAWWRWTGALAAALLVTALVLWRVERQHPQPIARRPTDSPEQMPSRTVANPRPAIEAEPVAPVTVRRTRKHTSAQPALAAVEPKLDRFPSPQPLSEEELALVRYVQSFPKEATLIAQSQEEFAIETQKEMSDAGSRDQPSGSMQQER